MHCVALLVNIDMDYLLAMKVTTVIMCCILFANLLIAHNAMRNRPCDPKANLSSSDIIDKLLWFLPCTPIGNSTEVLRKALRECRISGTCATISKIRNG